MTTSETTAAIPAASANENNIPERKRKRSRSGSQESEPLAPPKETSTEQEQAIPSRNQPDGNPEGGDSASETAPLSKNQQKKLLKKQKWEASRESRRALRREKMTAKRVRQREARIAAKANPQGQPNPGNHIKRKPTRKLERRSKRLNIKCIVDCAFDDLMMDKEVASLGSQVSRCYSDNRIAKYSMNLCITSVDKRLRDHLNLMHGDKWNSWKKITITDTDYEVPHEDVEAGNIIYLSSDADETLQTLDEGKTYIVGGIVDKNRYKGLCFNKAVGQKLRTAKLPIEDYIKMFGRTALTTNQVVEIMLKWLELKDWQKAFEMVIPMRKTKKKVDSGNEGKPTDGVEEIKNPKEEEATKEDESTDDEMENPVIRELHDDDDEEDDGESSDETGDEKEPTKNSGF